jgi:outer membrane protein assembly factor BamB
MQPTAYTRREQRRLASVSSQLVGVVRQHRRRLMRLPLDAQTTALSKGGSDRGGMNMKGHLQARLSLTLVTSWATMLIACGLLTPATTTTSSPSRTPPSTTGIQASRPPLTTRVPTVGVQATRQPGGMQVQWERKIWNSAPKAFKPYPTVWLPSSTVVPYLTIYPPAGAIEPVQASTFYRPYFVGNDAVFFLDEQRYTNKVDIKTGKQLWRSDIQGTLLGISKNIVFVNRDDERIFALDTTTGKEKWKLILASLVPSGTRLVVSAGILLDQALVVLPIRAIQYGIPEEPGYSYPTFGGIVVLREETGAVAWTDFRNQNVVALGDDVIVSQFRDASYVGCSGRKLSGGTEQWRTSPGHNCTLLQLDPVDGVLYLRIESGASEVDFIAIDIKSGNYKWGSGLASQNKLTLRPSGLIQCGDGRAWLDEEYVVVPYCDASSRAYELLAFDRTSGALWMRLPQPREFTAYLAENNLVISYPELGTSFGIDLKTKQTLWRNDDLNLSEETRQLLSLVAKGVLIVPFTKTNETWGLDPASGKILWRQYLIWQPLLGGYCDIQGDLLFCVNQDHRKIIGLETKTGKVVLETASLPGYPMTMQLIQNDLWLVQSFGGRDQPGTLTLVRLARQ